MHKPKMWGLFLLGQFLLKMGRCGGCFFCFSKTSVPKGGRFHSGIHIKNKNELRDEAKNAFSFEDL